MHRYVLLAVKPFCMHNYWLLPFQPSACVEVRLLTPATNIHNPVLVNLAQTLIYHIITNKVSLNKIIVKVDLKIVIILVLLSTSLLLTQSLCTCMHKESNTNFVES